MYHFIRDVKDKVVVNKIAQAENSIDMISTHVPLAKLKLYLSTIGVVESERPSRRWESNMDDEHYN